MNPTMPSSVPDDAEKLLRFITINGIYPTVPALPAHNHMGAIIVDAVLQRRQNWNNTVKPRLDVLVEKHLDAKTTNGLVELIEKGKLSDAIRWSGEERLLEIADIANVLNKLGIDTPAELAAALTAEPNRSEVRAALRKIKYVGCKTLDYLDILVGIPATAIDSRLQSVAEKAGIEDISYDHMQQVITYLAKIKNWNLRGLDHAMWASNSDSSYQSH